MVPPPDDDTAAAFRNTPLADALQTGDMAAVAFALRHGPTIVPTAADAGDPDEPDRVWTYQNPDRGQTVLLLFSDVRHKPAVVPATYTLQSPAQLRAYLAAHVDRIDRVFFDVAGPHPLQADPADLLAALGA